MPTKLHIQRQAQEHQNLSFRYFLCDAYPPSIKTISELSSISIPELQIDTHHTGKVLFVRTIETAVLDAAVQTIVEDEAGTAERLALYNANAAGKAEDVLPEGAIFAIKEPYFMATRNGHNIIRIDHPSHLVRLNPLDARLPPGLSAGLAGSTKSVVDWKKEGNAAYSAGDYLAALQAYSRGVEACGSDDQAVRRDLLRNRAVVNMFLKRYNQALADAEAAIIPTRNDIQEGDNALNTKAYERAGHSAYELGRFEQAEAYFNKITPTNDNATNALKRIEQRLQERSVGSYDMEKMSKSATKKHNRLDHADFTAKTTIRQAGVHGRGLFATEDIKAGQLIMCEKATCVAFASEEKSSSYTILNQNTERALAGTQATLLFNLVQKLLYNAELGEKFFDLHDGGYHPKTSPQTIDGLVSIDAFRTLAIIEHNSFGCPTVRSSNSTAQKELASTSGHPSTGLWLRTAYTNHACNGNAMRSFIGDMMIIRATRAIAKDEEILMPYRLPNPVNTATQEELQKVWGFKCDCSICTTEASSAPTQRKKRAQLIEKAATLLKTPPPNKPVGSSSSTLAQVEKLLVQLANTYDERKFENKPRLGLVAPGLWLCQAYKEQALHDKLLETATGLLRNLGFVVTINGQGVDIERSHCLVEGRTMDAAMYAVHALRAKGEGKAARQMEDLAKELYLLMYGELRGFEDRYGGS